MFKEQIKSNDLCLATVSRGSDHVESMQMQGEYYAVCRDKTGNIKWEAGIKNLVTTVGKNYTMDTILGGGTGGAIVMGLKGSGTAVVGDIQSSHSSWLEVGLANAPTYSGTRKTPIFSASVAGAKTTSTPVVFNITGTGVIAGCFINISGSSAIDSTTGTLFSAGDFTNGVKNVSSGDTLSVTYTATAA